MPMEAVLERKIEFISSEIMMRTFRLFLTVGLLVCILGSISPRHIEKTFPGIADRSMFASESMVRGVGETATEICRNYPAENPIAKAAAPVTVGVTDGDSAGEELVDEGNLAVAVRTGAVDDKVSETVAAVISAGKRSEFTRIDPTDASAVVPTDIPTVKPTDVPTVKPTDVPTNTPTDIPTVKPTDVPTNTPTDIPTVKPSDPSADIPSSDTDVKVPDKKFPSSDSVSDDTKSDTPADAEDSDEDPVMEMRVIRGFMVNGSGRITGYQDASVAKAGLLSLPEDKFCRSVGSHAFAGLENDCVEIYIPANITWIEPEAFAELSNVFYIEVAPDNPAYYSKGGILYSADGQLVYYPGGR